MGPLWPGHHGALAQAPTGTGSDCRTGSLACALHMWLLLALRQPWEVEGQADGPSSSTFHFLWKQGLHNALLWP